MLAVPIPLLAKVLAITIVAVAKIPASAADLAVVVLLWPSIMVGGIGSPDSKVLNAPVNRLGEASFALYAIHYPIATCWWKVAHVFPCRFEYAVAIALSFLALAIAKLIDRGAARLAEWTRAGPSDSPAKVRTWLGGDLMVRSTATIARSEAGFVRGPGASATSLVLLGVVSFLVLFFAMPREMTPYDEGIILSDAARLLNGEVFHRDFYANYGPAQSFFVAALFKLFGPNFLVERAYDLAIRASILVVGFKMLRENCGLLVSWMATLAMGSWLLGLNYYLYPIFPCILFSLFSSYLVVRFGEASSKGLIAAGLCTGLTALFRYETGFFVLAAHVGFLLLLACTDGQPQGRFKRLVRNVFAYGLGVGMAFLPVAALFLAVSPLKPFLDDIITFPTKFYPAMRSLPFPNLSALRRAPQEASVYLPLLALGAALVEFLRPVGGGMNVVGLLRRRDRAGLYLLVLGSVTAVLFLKGVVRVSSLHMFMSTAPSLLLIAILCALWWGRGAAGYMGTAVMVLAVLVPTAAALKLGIGPSVRSPNRSVAGWLVGRTGVLKRRGAGPVVCDSAAASGIAELPEDYARTANYLAAHSQPGERIFVGLDRHDKILLNPVTLYFASRRLPGTHWHQFDPGLQTRADIQTDMVDDLRRNHVRWIVRDASFDGIIEPNGSALSSGVQVLDGYIAAYYRPVATAGEVSIWLDNSSAAPAQSRPAAQCEAAPLDQGAGARS